MRNVWSIARREFRSYFVSPIAYVVLALFLLLAGYFFFSILSFFNLQSMFMLRNPQMMQRLNVNDLVLRPLYVNLSVILLFLVPLLTMKLFADEQRLKTFELLLTSPVRLWEIVGGKYLAALLFWFLMLACTLLYPAALFHYGNPEAGPVVSTYVGFALLGAAYLSVGLLFSSTTENQIIAGVVSFAVLLLFWVLDWASQVAGPPVSTVLQQLSLTEHYRDFTKGVVDTQHLVFFFSFIFFGLFLTHRVLDSRRWR